MQLNEMILNGFYNFGKSGDDFIFLPILNEGWVIIQFALGTHIYLNTYTKITWN